MPHIVPRSERTVAGEVHPGVESDTPEILFLPSSNYM